MSGDTRAIIGTIVGTGVVVAGLLSAQISSVNASLSRHIDDVNASLSGRIDDLNASLSRRIDDVNASLSGRIDDLNASLSGRIDDVNDRVDRLEARLDGFDELLRAIEVAFGKIHQRLATLERTLLPSATPPHD